MGLVLGIAPHVQGWDDIAYGLTLVAFSAAVVRSWMGPDLTPRWIQKLDVLRGEQGPACRATPRTPLALQPVIVKKSRAIDAQLWSREHDATVSVRMDYEGVLQTRTYRGSGFIISRDGYIATAAHNVISSFAEGGLTNGKLVRASYVRVTITNLNGKQGDHRSIYARIVGTSGVSDIAVLKIDELDGNHPWLTLSRDIPATGSGCVVIGNPVGADPQSFAAGHIRDGQYFDPQGDQVVESVFTDVIAYPGNSGSPILNDSGECIGIYTFGSVSEVGMGGGVSMRIGYPIIKAMVDADRLRLAGTPVTDPHIDEDGNYISGFTGIRWVACSDFEKDALGHPGADIIGAIVDRYYSTAIFPATKQNDLVTHIDGIAIGNLPGQVPPSTPTIYKLPGETVTLTVERAPDFTPMQITQTLGTIPGRYNYPLVNTASYVFRGKKRRAVVQLLQKTRI